LISFAKIAIQLLIFKISSTIVKP